MMPRRQNKVKDKRQNLFIEAQIDVRYNKISDEFRALLQLKRFIGVSTSPYESPSIWIKSKIRTLQEKQSYYINLKKIDIRLIQDSTWKLFRRAWACVYTIRVICTCQTRLLSLYKIFMKQEAVGPLNLENVQRLRSFSLWKQSLILTH